MVLPSDDPNIRYIEKHFSVQRDDDTINNVRNRVAVYEDSIRRHYEMIPLLLKGYLALQLTRANDINTKLYRQNNPAPSSASLQ